MTTSMHTASAHTKPRARIVAITGTLIGILLLSACGAREVEEASSEVVTTEVPRLPPPPEPTTTPVEETSSPAPPTPIPPVPNASLPAAHPTLDPAKAAELFERRPYKLAVPNGLDRDRAAPLVIFLHGYGASAKRLNKILDVASLAESRGFLYVTPDGSREPRGTRYWNATPACCDFTRSKANDVAYLAAVIDDVKRRAKVDERRVFVIGYSNGGFMAYRLACELSDRITGVVSVAGAANLDESRCRPAAPVAVLQIHGDADEHVLYGGGHVLGRADVARHPSAEKTVALWSKRNGCSASSTAGDPMDLEERISGPETEVLRYSGCKGGAAELWTVRGGNHFVAQNRVASEKILSFLEAHPREAGE